MAHQLNLWVGSFRFPFKPPSKGDIPRPPSTPPEAPPLRRTPCAGCLAEALRQAPGALRRLQARRGKPGVGVVAFFAGACFVFEGLFFDVGLKGKPQGTLLSLLGKISIEAATKAKPCILARSLGIEHHAPPKNGALSSQGFAT